MTCTLFKHLYIKVLITNVPDIKFCQKIYVENISISSVIHKSQQKQYFTFWAGQRCNTYEAKNGESFLNKRQICNYS